MKKLLIIVSIIFMFISCKKDNKTDQAKTKPALFGNILILGNSITYAPVTPSIGWNTNCGMAASAPEKDYVHLLTAKFLQLNSKAIVQAKNIAAFEVDYNNYNFDTELKTYRDQNPDLLIIRIGENVVSSFDSVAFAKRYQALLAYMKVGNPNLKILAAGSFWRDREYANVILSRYTPYISLSFLGNDFSNYAFDRPNVSDGVKQHPGDRGMQGIAETIWAKVGELK